MKNVFMNNLLEHLDLLESIFQKDQNVIEAVLTNIPKPGDPEDIISHFFVELHIPLHFMNYKIINAIGNRKKSTPANID